MVFVPRPTIRFANWIGIFLTPCTINTVTITTKNKTTNSKTNLNKPLEPNCNWNSEIKAIGKEAIIPIIINKEIPFPIPLSVIFSPNHMAKTVPVDNIIILENQKIPAGILGSTAPWLLMYVK